MTDSLEWDTLGKDVAYTCPGFDIVTDTVKLPDGNYTEFDYLSEPPSVAILPFTADNELVLIEEWRQPVHRINRGIPVGSVEPEDESIEAAARRELGEETGFSADEMDHLITVEPANGIANSLMHFFVATDCRETMEQDLDFNESIRVTTALFEAVLEDVLAGNIRDGRAILGITYYRLRTQ